LLVSAFTRLLAPRWGAGLTALLLSGATGACGTDAERRYADLSSAEIALEGGGYRLRYPSPPWTRLRDDPLATGARRGVVIGGTNRDILPQSGAVLEIAKQSGASDPEQLAVPKYRLEAVLLRCAEDELASDESCAAVLAALDQAARAEEGDYDLFGAVPREGHNDFEQPFYEFMGRTSEEGRYQRVVYYETEVRDVTARLFVEANPDLDEPEMTRLVNAFEPTRGQEEP
jgi:hypothetical protein